jgi:hypothetical protein
MSRPWELHTTPSENDRLAEDEAGRSVGAMQAAHSSRGAIVTPSAPGRALLLAACRGERTDGVPVWFMRQAGRSLPEYRAVRSRASLMGQCCSEREEDGPWDVASEALDEAAAGVPHRETDAVADDGGE